MEWKILLIALFITALALAPVLSVAQESDTQPTPEETATESAATEEGVDVESPGVLPDSPFYGLKLFTERIRLALTFNEKARIRLRLKLAERRLAEAERMTLRNKTQVVQRLMKRYEARIKEAEQVRERLRARNVTAEDVDEWMNRTTNKHIYVLRRVLQRVPLQARPGIQTALQRAEENREKIRERLLQRIERAEKRLERAEERIERAKERVERAEERVERAEERIEEVKERVNETKSKLECETAADCEGLPHIAVVGHWECEENRCTFVTEGETNITTNTTQLTNESLTNETETSNETAVTTQSQKGQTLTTLVPI